MHLLVAALLAVAPSVARLHLQSQAGETRPCSGFVLRTGELLTCGHCVSDEEDCAAMIAEFGPSGVQARCKKILRMSTFDDIALVQLEWPADFGVPEGLALAHRSLPPGSSVVVAGFPAGAVRALTFTSGKVLKPASSSSSALLYDAPTLPGNSGSPVIDPETLEVTALHCASSDFGGSRRGYGPRVERIRGITGRSRGIFH